MYRKEKKVTVFKIQLHNYSVLTYKFYTNIHERVVNTQIHPSIHLFLKKLQSKVKTVLLILILQYQAQLLLLLQLVSEFSKEDPNPPTSFYEIIKTGFPTGSIRLLINQWS